MRLKLLYHGNCFDGCASAAVFTRYFVEREGTRLEAFSYDPLHHQQGDPFAGHAFDAISIVADALKRTGSDVTAANLRDAIESTKGLIGVGGTFTFSPTDHNGLTAKDLVMYRVEGGTWKLAE